MLEMEEIILASQSPRRSEILKLMQIPFTAIPAKNECGVDPSLPIRKAVMAVARKKAEEVAKLHPGRIVLGADTVVSIDGEILGKPLDKQHAFEMLRKLSGNTHTVYTGVWVCGKKFSGGFTDSAKVKFYPLSDREILDYIATLEPMDKAGAYGIQGYGMRLIKSITGDFYTVMGLPGGRLLRFLSKIAKS
ncbi:MAG TPA: septum formation protein Maf [Clostridiales bacterium]|nr:septum formation protein Maf [Clostridiales bacterium]